MSGDGWTAAIALAGLTFSLGSLAVEPRQSRSAAERPVSAAVLREPAAVHGRLRAICEDAGYQQSGYRVCAKTMAETCQRAGVTPASARCWQWLVDRDARGQLDRRNLGSAVPDKEKK